MGFATVLGLGDELSNEGALYATNGDLNRE